MDNFKILKHLPRSSTTTASKLHLVLRLWSALVCNQTHYKLYANFTLHIPEDSERINKPHQRSSVSTWMNRRVGNILFLQKVNTKNDYLLKDCLDFIGSLTAVHFIPTRIDNSPMFLTYEFSYQLQLKVNFSNRLKQNRNHSKTQRSKNI